MNELISLCGTEETAAVEAINWETVWATVFTGISVVFLILALLIVFFILMGKIFQALDKKKKDAAAAKAAAAANAAPKQETAAVQAAEEVYDDDDEEIIAVISAAIAAYSAADGKQYRITGIRKREKTQRPSWNAAGLAENTRGFMN